MCDTCYQRGYADFPGFVGSTEHPDSYKEGFNARAVELGDDPTELYDTDFCQKCYDRGKHDFYNDVYSPPTTSALGHYESYRNGYKAIEEKKANERREQNLREEREIAEQYSRQQHYQASSYSSSSDDSNSWWINLIVIIVVIFIALWLAVKVVLPLIAINIATIAFVLSFVKRQWRNQLLVLSFLGGIFIILDCKNGWVTQTLTNNVSFFGDITNGFLYLNFFVGLAALYFIITDRLDAKSKQVTNKGHLSKRNLIVMGSLLLSGILAMWLLFYY